MRTPESRPPFSISNLINGGLPYYSTSYERQVGIGPVLEKLSEAYSQLGRLELRLFSIALSRKPVTWVFVISPVLVVAYSLPAGFHSAHFGASSPSASPR
ncbi:hypothetical protein QBC43DRAFT_285761 [Cladorrhinum sp. PSN259]|nr:hypothetical protein QBC43DRAFT_285761 [Cladorrhinum sp. PSN259]